MTRQRGETIPLVKPALPPAGEVQAAVQRIMETGILTRGPFLEELEAGIAGYLGVKHAVGVSSGTSGLLLTLFALKLEAGEVLVPSYTFMATIVALLWNGLTPAFVDVDPGTANLDPGLVRSAITPQTRAVLAVHNHGNPADIDALRALAADAGLPLIVDAAHALGARHDAVPVGSCGTPYVFSLSQTKVLAAGEGGFVTTNDSELARRVRVGREYGNRGDYQVREPGINARLAEMPAALALLGLPRLEGYLETRRTIARHYMGRLRDLRGLRFQEIRSGDESSWKDLVLFIDNKVARMDRDGLAAYLLRHGVESRRYWYPPAHHQPAFSRFPRRGDLVHTETLSRQCLSVPIWSTMRLDQCDEVCDVIERALT